MPFFSSYNPREHCNVAWIEESFHWLLKQFGMRAFRNVEVLLPTPDYFPDEYFGTKKCVQKIVNRVCQYMRIDASRIRLEIYSEGRDTIQDLLLFDHKTSGGSAGLYSNPGYGRYSTIAIEKNKLNEPMGLVAAISHELAHVHLLGDRRLSSNNKYHEQMTDLTTVFWGLGIITANASMQMSEWSTGTRSGYTMSRQGYLHYRDFSYALAAFCWMKNIHKPKWSHYLESPDVRYHFKKSLNYLKRTKDTTLPSYEEIRPDRYLN